MSLESVLTTALLTVCPRVFPDFAPVSTARPYVTYQQVGGQAIRFMDHAAASKRNARMQINVWSNTRAEAVTLAQSIENALCALTTMQCDPDAALTATFDADIPVYGCIQDFNIWA
jgi:hypothetical protein